MAEPTPQQTASAIYQMQQVGQQTEIDRLNQQAEQAATGAANSVPELPLPGTLGTLAPAGDGPYLGYGQSVAYLEDMGLVATPVAAAARSAPLEILRIHTGMCIKVITAVATRLGAKFFIPHWDTGSNNDVLLSRARILISPAKTVEGDRIWACVVQYTYACQVPPADDDLLDFGKIPLDLSSAPTLDPADYVSYLTSASPVTLLPGMSGIPKINY